MSILTKINNLYHLLNSKGLVTWIKIGISGGLLVLIFRTTDWHTTLNVLSKVPPLFIIVSIIGSLVGLAGGVYRWGSLIPVALSWPSIKPFMRGGFLGSFYSLFLPSALGGDVVKWGLTLNNQVKKSRLASSIIIDRAVGIVSATLVAGLTLGYLLLTKHQLPTVLIHSVGLISGIVVLACFCWIALSKLSPKLLYKLPLPKSVQDPTLISASPKQFLQAMMISIIILLTMNLTSFLILNSLGVQLQFLELLLFSQVTMVIASLPISFGGLGTSELSFVYLATQSGVPEYLAISTVALNLALRLISTLLAGGVGVMLGRK